MEIFDIVDEKAYLPGIQLSAVKHIRKGSGIEQRTYGL